MCVHDHFACARARKSFAINVCECVYIRICINYAYGFGGERAHLLNVICYMQFAGWRLLHSPGMSVTPGFRPTARLPTLLLRTSPQAIVRIVPYNFNEIMYVICWLEWFARALRTSTSVCCQAANDDDNDGGSEECTLSRCHIVIHSHKHPGYI